MSIRNTSAIYTKFLTKWEKCRDAVNGEDAVKYRQTRYLPKLSGMNDEEYKDFLLRAQFYNATGRTLDGLAGMLGRKPVIIEVPKGMEKYLENVDGKGHSASQFILMCAKDTLTTGWGSVLVDMPNTEGVKSQSEFEDRGLYAYMVYYNAESSINWRWQNIGRQQKLKYVVLKEKVIEDKGDYNTELKYYYRVLELDEKINAYVQTLYNDRGEIITQTIPKSKNGEFKEIPFAFVLSKEEPEEPILLDLVNVNLSHYRKSADLENGGHLTGVPTPWGQGFEPELDEKGKPKPFELGGSRFKYLPSGASLSYLEFGGSGCQLLRTMMYDDESRMATLGARIIAQQKKGVESAETAKIHNSAENSVLADFAIDLSETFSKLLRIYLQWSTGTEIKQKDVKVTINTDYDVSNMSPAELTALVELWQNGGIAKRDMQLRLKDGEIIDADRNLDEMNAEIEEEQKARTMPAFGAENGEPARKTGKENKEEEEGGSE